MPKKDLLSDINPRVALAPVVVTDNTAQNTAIIDTLGYLSLTFLITLGVLADADATFAVTMTHGDASDLSDGAAVASTDLAGTLALAGFQFDSDSQCRKVGYIGNKRYVKLTITPTNNTGNAPMAVTALLGHALQRPTDNPPT